MMAKHKFKIVRSTDVWEENVYRIYDLTDTSLVGITEMFEHEDEVDRRKRTEYSKEIKANVGLRVRIVGYGIFVTFDDVNTKWVPVPERKYLLSVLRQMAKCFEQRLIKKYPEKFDVYRIPKSGKVSTVTDGRTLLEKEIEEDVKRGQLVGLIVLAVTVVCFTVALIAFPDFRDLIKCILEIPFMLFL